jgi:hypothetical protein
MQNDYAYSVAQCDVAADKRGGLQSYRDKRRLWLSWIDTDEHHAIWSVLSSMVWTDVSFKTLTQLAINDENNTLHNTLLAQALIDGHVATQVLAIRRLVDNGNSDIISLRRLVKDIRRNFHLLTRENCVCFDGLPYDYEAVMRKEMLQHAGKEPFWGQTSGPGAHGTSRMAQNNSTGWRASIPRNEAAKIAFPCLFSQPSNDGLTKAAPTSSRSGATPISRMRAGRMRGSGSPISS